MSRLNIGSNAWKAASIMVATLFIHSRSAARTGGLWCAAIVDPARAPKRRGGDGHDGG
ncbi:hypothetical protein [Mycolicibacterium monacense]|uniref:Uncharacterized protein n=1 Tax=Mycolicibacterium monacense TaxID=85693 RepID=A0AAD1IXV6_MYCMB|nr:hypothetical protein [Mycolicibacterium monacense]BBZ62523.1 hypothetical protein MMON_38240 [Mycolicibacterium monacense]